MSTESTFTTLGKRDEPEPEKEPACDGDVADGIRDAADARLGENFRSSAKMTGQKYCKFSEISREMLMAYVMGNNQDTTGRPDVIIKGSELDVDTPPPSPEKPPTPPPVEEVAEEAPVAPEPWACSSCTFICQPAESLCEVCGTPKPGTYGS